MQRRNADPADKPRRNARADRQSPSNASAGSSSSAGKNNTNRVQDPNALASRLKQLDDCMRQVKSLMKNLEKSEDPGAHGHLQRLRQMMQHLNAELEGSGAHSRRYNALDQRQRRLEERSASPAHKVSSQTVLNVVDNCVDDEDEDDGNMRSDLEYPPPTREDEENLVQQNAIMRKILESKKKLLELQDQHAHLASMQKRAENKLAETRAFQDQLALNNPDLSEWVNQIQRESAAGTLLNPTLASREPKRSIAASGAGRRTQQHQHTRVSAAEAAGGDNNWTWTAETSAVGTATSAEAELKQLERRLHQLQGMAQQQDVLEGPSAADLSDLCRERRKLQDRLKDLHDQKVEMDQLLSELSLLQSASGLGIVPVGHPDIDPREDPLPNGPSNESGSSDHSTLKDKKRQVEEMRRTLQQLRSAVKNLEQGVGMTGTATAILEGATGTVVPQHSHGARVVGGTSSHKTDNLRGPDFPARRHYEAEGRANEEQDSVAMATVSSQVPPGGTQGRSSDGDVLAEKVRQLQATRSQLQYLQGIVTSFQEGDLEGDSGVTSATASLGEGDSRRQRRELQELQEQQLRLTLLRQQLLTSHPLLAAAASKNQLKTSTPDGPRRLDVSPRGGGEASGGGGHLGGGHVGASPSPSKKDNVNALPKNLFDVPKSSNRTQDHPSNLECSGAGGSLLREKAILEELLQQERSKQLLSYSHNEDVRTSPSSGSQSSEPPGGPESVVAGGNTTIAATWGGSSTQENLEDDEDDEDPVEDSIEAGRDSEEGSRSDVDAKAEPPWIPARERVFSVPDSGASLGRMDNRISHGSLARAVTNGTCPRPGGGQWGYNQATGGPIHRQGSSHREAPVEAVSPQSQLKAAGASRDLREECSNQLALNNPDLSEWVNQIQRESAAGTLLNPTLASREPKRSIAASGAGRRTQQHQHTRVSAAEAAGGDNNWTWTAETSAVGTATSAEAELKQLERRLHQLQGMAQQQDVLEGPSAADLSDLCRERRKLQDRLKDLHDQKVEMDQLLSELSLLQSASGLGIVPVGHPDIDPREDPLPNGPSNESGSSDHSTLKDKKRQVEEMRRTLQQLRSAVKNLEQGVGMTGTATAILEGATGTVVPQHSHGARVVGGTSSHKTDNLRGPDFPARRHYEAEGRANEEQDSVAMATVSSQVPPGGTQGRSSDGDVLAEKVRQLQATRSQLQYLQGIVTSFQEGDLEGDSGVTSATASLGEGDSRRQRRELQELQEQQLRLTLLRQQLLTSHPLLAAAASKNQLKTSTPDGPRRLDVSPRGGGEASGGGGHLGGGHVGASPSPSKKDNVNALPKNLFDVPKSSNRTQDHPSNLECSGAGGSLLREKAILEELLQQERSKQLLSYSHNEDVRTSPSSGSQSSEPPGGPESVVAGGNTTIAATWGGSSTQENLEDDEDDEDPVEDSIEAGRDSEEGSRSDVDAKAEPPWIPARERVFSVPDSGASLGRMDNRISHGSLARAVTNGTCPRPGGGQWGYNQATGGPIHRQGSSHREAPVEAVSPQVATDEQDGAGERVPGVPVFPGWHQQAVHQLHQQLEQTGALCNSALQEHQQQAFAGALLATSAGAVSPDARAPPGSAQPRLPGFDAVQQYAIQQQQQLLLSIVHCYHLLSIQQLEINQLQHAIQQVCLNGGEEAPPLAMPPAFQLPEHPLQGPLFLGAPWAVPSPGGPVGVLAQGMAVPQQTTSHAVSEARGGPPLGATLNNQVVPGSRANNFWDNFRSYSRQNLLSTSATTPPKTNELPANFQVQQSHLASGRSPATAASGTSRPKPSSVPRPVGELTAIVPPQDRGRHMRPVANVSLQDSSARAAGSRLNIGKQQQPTGFQDGTIPTAVAFPYSPSPPSRCRQPAHSPPQQPASEALKSSIRAEVSRLLEGREDTASLAAVLRQLQFLNCGATGTLQQPSGVPQACGGARRKIPSSTKSNIPKENRPASGERRPVFQRVASESSPDLVASVEFAFDSRPRTEETLSDSTFDKNSSRGSTSVTARKRTKPLYAPAGQSSLSGSSGASAERNVPAEHLVPERDCATDEEQGAAARPLDLEPTLEQTWPERDTTVYVQPLDLLPSANKAAGADVQVPVLDNAGLPLLQEPVGAVRAANPEFQAMYGFELALLQQGIVAGGEYQGEEAEDDEDRELETEPEAEGTQDLAEADQSPAAEQDAADQQPEDVAAPAAVGAVGGADGGPAEVLVADDGMAARQAASDTPEVPTEDPQQRVDGEDNPVRQHDSVPQPPPCE
ncbi:uncharacterized protein ISCGN_027718 [Ixodes scapularis]